MRQEDELEESGWVLSHSVRNARDTFSPDEPITAGEFVEAILDQGHRTDYAAGQATDWSPDAGDPSTARRTAEEWLVRVQQTFDPERAGGAVEEVDSGSETIQGDAESMSSPPVLDGRLVIVGLAMLENSLQHSLERLDILSALREELETPVEDLLSAEGRTLLELDDQVSPLTDTPLESADADRLQRAAFASYLAERIAYIRLSTEDAFSILLYGPWGSGKSTLFNFLNEHLRQRRRVILSEPVERAVDEDLEARAVTAGELAAAIIAKWEPDGQTSEGDEPSPAIKGDERRIGESRQTPAEWFEEVRTLYVHDRVRTLDAPLVLLGLSMLEPELHDAMTPSDYVEWLGDDLPASLEDVLSDRGQVLGSALISATDRTTRLDNGTDGQRDEDTDTDGVAEANDQSSGEPASTVSDEDSAERGSDAAADAVETAAAERLDIPSSERAWQIVRFNAWQHQHVSPPWWALMDRIFHESESELSALDRVREYSWRLSSRRLAVLAGSTLLVWALVLVVLPRVLPPGTGGGSDLSRLGMVADDVATLFALLVTVWAGISAVSKPLFLDSARAAQSYVEFSNEPMTKIQDRFNTLVERVPTHLLIFIDDLDRCRSQYVVELLEGIQTLFKDAPVIFIVAADRRWVDTCFEEVYDGHTDAVKQPGKTLGMLFSEKAFQLSAPVPGVPDTLHERYWWHLIDVTPGEPEDGEIQRGGPDEEESSSDDRPPADVSEEEGSWSDVKRWALPEVEERTEHLLQDFQPLLDQNPRAMKQLINAYSMNRALATLTGISIDRETLALWTILSLRWPALATHLKRSPDDIEKIRQRDGGEEFQITGGEQDLRPLFSEPAVVDVVTGAPDAVQSTLDAAAIRRCTHLSS